ncbi:response regulator [Gammaproteobacteria bacterium]|nr:response regulator [Gammaproteobacteria bacterium]
MVEIIYVEDDPLTGKICKHLFSIIPNTYLTVFTTGYEALDQLKSHPYDMILLDVGLSDIDGLEVARLIRTKLKINTPIVVTSAHIDAGMESPDINEFIEKPLTHDIIKRIVKKYTSNSG